MKSVFCILLLLTLSINASWGQLSYEVIENGGFIIDQGRFYKNPNVLARDQYNLQLSGPYFVESYISDRSVRTLSELSDRYPISRAKLPRHWPANIMLDSAQFKVALFENGVGIPVIQTKGGAVFSFLIDQNELSFDFKRIAGTRNSRKIVFDTAKLKVEKP